MVFYTTAQSPVLTPVPYPSLDRKGVAGRWKAGVLAPAGVLARGGTPPGVAGRGVRGGLGPLVRGVQGGSITLGRGSIASRSAIKKVHPILFSIT